MNSSFSISWPTVAIICSRVLTAFKLRLYFFMSCSYCPSCSTSLNSIGWATRAVIKKYSLKPLSHWPRLTQSHSLYEHSWSILQLHLTLEKIFSWFSLSRALILRQLGLNCIIFWPCFQVLSTIDHFVTVFEQGIWKTMVWKELMSFVAVCNVCGITAQKEPLC